MKSNPYKCFLTYRPLVPLQAEQRVTSCLHLARSLAVSLASLQSTHIISRFSSSLSCHVLLGLSTLLMPFSGVYSKARLAGLVAGSLRRWPTNRLILVATR